MRESLVLITIAGMAVVTIVPRLLPIWLLAGKSLPAPLQRWLKYVPVSVIAAMVFPAVMTQNGHLALHLKNPYFLAALPTFAVAVKTRNLFATLLIGMGTVACLRWFI